MRNTSNTTVDFAENRLRILERLDTMQEEVDALSMMVSAYILGPDEFNERRAYNAMYNVIGNLEANIAATKNEISDAPVVMETA